MHAVLVPERVRWLPDLQRWGSDTHQPFETWAPWMLPAGWVHLAPKRWQKRLQPFVVTGRSRRSALFPVVQQVLRLWSRRQTHRQMSARFAGRSMADGWAANKLDLRITQVSAPSLAALRTFARARTLGIRTVLLQDLPCLRRLHHDLDRAVQAHPTCVFLKRYRAHPSMVVKQEREWVLADEIWVRSSFAMDVLQESGVRQEKLRLWPRVPDHSMPTSSFVPNAAIHVLLAGSAAARHGTVEALAALAGFPQITLLVRPGEGLEPASLLQSNQVRIATTQEFDQLQGVHAVFAPAWCESDLPEVQRAQQQHIPVIATRQGAGAHLSPILIQPGDAVGLAQALQSIVEEKQGAVVPITP